jgi:hypothetical protein
LNNPLKWIDQFGDTISLASLTDEERAALLRALYEFTGNTYTVNDALELVLDEIGAESSETATAFLNDAIASKTNFSVQHNNHNKYVRLGHANTDKGTVELDFDDFKDIKYGRVPSASLNLGSVLIHELRHAYTKLGDPQGAEADRTTGPIVDFVNQIRSERGLPTRGPAYSGDLGFFGRIRFNFQNVNPEKPDKVYYVRVRNY